MKSFVTETDIEYVKKQSYKVMGVIFIILSLLALLLLLISVRIYACVEIIVILGCLMGVFSKKYAAHDYVLRFEGRDLIVRNRAGTEGFRLEELSIGDFTFKQSEREKKLNYCTVLINGSAIAFGGIKNCREMKTYINANCKNSYHK